MPHLCLDGDVAVPLAALLIGSGYPTRTTRDERRLRARDHDQLMFAARRGWVLVTHNRGDFRLLHDAWLGWTGVWSIPEEHAGILVVDQEPPHRLAAEIAQFLATNPPLANALWDWKASRGWARRQTM